MIDYNPYYPYRDIPVPNSGDAVAESVGSIWQGLKVFEKRDYDEELWGDESVDNLIGTINKNKDDLER